MAENHIFPFLWMRGEAEEILREEIGRSGSADQGGLCGSAPA